MSPTDTLEGLAIARAMRDSEMLYATVQIFHTLGFTALVGSSLFVLRRKLPASPRRYRALGYPVIPALFVLVAVWLVINSLSATPVESVVGLVLIAIGLPFFFFFRRSGWITRARTRGT